MRTLQIKHEGIGKMVIQTERLWVMCASFVLTGLFLLLMRFAQEQSLVVLVGDYLHWPSWSRGHGQPPNWNNLLVEDYSNYTSALTEALRLNRSSSASPCHSATTNATAVEGLPEPVDGRFRLRADAVHRLTLVAWGTDGNRRCAGGDYFEADLHDHDNLRYRSRPPTVDFGNGSYGVEIRVPARFAGNFTLEVWLLFGNWHGMDYAPETWVKQSLMLALELEIVDHELPEESGERVWWRGFRRRPPPPPAESLALCTPGDFRRTTWQGRWTRSWFNDGCLADGDARFRCLPDDRFACEEPWCFGPVGRLESNGWEYSAHCGFKIFEREEAWRCLDGRWFLMWGDSNFQDTVRNLLLFVLGWELPTGQNLADFQLERTFEAGFINPRELDQLFRVSQLFNGANYQFDNGEGLNTMKHEEHQQQLLAHFNGTRWPDTVIMNSGLHDGEQFERIEDYTASADYAIKWWVKLYNGIPADRRPQLIWRSTVTPAGIARKMMSNPNKMEMYNQVIVEKLQQMGDKLPVRFIDGFDLTFPFHYNNDFSDGGHYGRAPGVNLPPWYRRPHWYFVDVMLAHIFLNAVCPST